MRAAERLLLLGVAGPARRTGPAAEITYTNNWPSESLIDNQPSRHDRRLVGRQLRAAAGGHRRPGVVLRRRSTGDEDEQPRAAREATRCWRSSPTPSMRATLKYFWVVAALIVAQVGLGAVTAHYGVEGSGFYGIPLAKWLPYAVTRTWHTQLGIFWIATAWLATGLFMAPAVSGHEPRFQRLGVNFLFVCLLVIVVGSMAGQWLAVQQRLGQRDELLVRPPGLRVRRPRPVLAALPARRPVPLAGPDGPGDVAGLPQSGREPAPAGAVPARLGGHPAVLRRRA